MGDEEAWSWISAAQIVRLSNLLVGLSDLLRGGIGISRYARDALCMALKRRRPSTFQREPR